MLQGFVILYTKYECWPILWLPVLQYLKLNLTGLLVWWQRFFLHEVLYEKKKGRDGEMNGRKEEGGREFYLTILHFLVIYLQKTNFIIYLNVSWMWKKSTSAILPLPESFSSIRNAGRFANGHSCMFQKNFVCYFRIVFISFWSVVSQPVGCDPFEGQMTHSQESSETIGKHIYLHYDL